MAIIYKQYPAYYGTLQREQGLSFSGIEKMASQNRVYIGETGKALEMQKAGKSTNEILNYFRTQGYNSTQLSDFQKVLVAPVRDTPTGLTKQQKFDNVLNQVRSGGLAVAELLTAFGVIKSNAVPQILLPSFEASQYSGIPQMQTYAINTGEDTILTQGGQTVPKPNVTPVQVGASGFPEWFNIQNGALFLAFLFILYLLVNGNSNNSQDYSNRKR